MNTVSFSESRFRGRQDFKHRALVKIGRIGTEKAKGRTVSDQEAAVYGKRRLATAAVGVASAATVLAGGKHLMDSERGANSFNNRVVACAEKLEGHTLRLNVDNNGELIVPAADYETVEACRIAEGDPYLAEHRLSATPSTTVPTPDTGPAFPTTTPNTTPAE